MDKPKPDHRPLALSLAIATLPHFPRLPWWIILWCVFFWAYSFSGHRENLKEGIRKWVLVALTIAGIAGVLSEYRTVLGQDAGVGLICIMASLKLLEVKSKRDYIITVFIMYFVIITHLLFSTSILVTIYMFFAVFSATSVLIHYTQPGISRKAEMKISFSLLLSAIPLMMILFVFFPRIQGTLWKGFRINSGNAGFSDSLSPGALSDMALTGEVAFRVEFNGKRPQISELYWKGIVYGFFDGHSWKKFIPHVYNGYKSEGRAEYDYIITMEPNNSRYMFVLGCPVSFPDGAEYITDGTLRSTSLITERLRYRVISEESCDSVKWIEPGFEFVSLPRSGNNLSINQAMRWKQKYKSQEEIVSAALDFLRNGGFVYSLVPPKLITEDIVDEFLFSSKKGYCEHYASSFAFLMRAAGIPSRVIGGYLGGDINPVGGHMTVTQDKAHAWVEVFLDNKGWTTVDPTAAVVPDRLTRGLSSVIPPDEMPVILRIPENRFIGSIWKKTAFFFDYINHGWNRFVIGYTYTRQKSLYDFLGVNPAKVSGALFLVFIIMFSSISVFLLVWRLRPGDNLRHRDPLIWAWSGFISRLEKAGISIEASEGPMDLMGKIHPLAPENKKEAELVILEYIRLRYASRHVDEYLIHAFLKTAGRFRPKIDRDAK